MTRSSLREKRPRAAAVCVATVLGTLLAAVGWGSPATAAIGACWDTTYRGVAMHVCDADQWLTAGSSWTFGNARLSMQTDGNLVIYDKRNGRAKWSTGTYGTRANRMDFHGNGRFNPLIVRDTRTGQVYWNSSPSATCPTDNRTVLALQGDSNFVMYCYKSGVFGRAIWATNTVF